MKTKISTEVAYVTRHTTFKVKRSRSRSQEAGTYCGGFPHSLYWVGIEHTRFQCVSLYLFVIHQCW